MWWDKGESIAAVSVKTCCVMWISSREVKEKKKIQKDKDEKNLGNKFINWTLKKKIYEMWVADPSNCKARRKYLKWRAKYEIRAKRRWWPYNEHFLWNYQERLLV